MDKGRAPIVHFGKDLAKFVVSSSLLFSGGGNFLKWIPGNPSPSQPFDFFVLHNPMLSPECWLAKFSQRPPAELSVRASIRDAPEHVKDLLFGLLQFCG
jgi:hypothetical protein